MRKMICALLCAILVLGLLPALADGVSEVMQVVNCSEYVSLRVSPDTKSDRIVKVHLGELVTGCTAAENEFVRCTWNGKTGYILAKYLKTTNYKVSDGILPNQMVVNCNEYVSLRVQPDTTSERLIKVPLGAVVTGCVKYSDTFVLCEYKGKTGYVLSKYLKTADYNKINPTPTPTPKTYAALPCYMQVVNVEQWVSLRASASTSAQVLANVPLGAVVENCVQVSDSFVRCEYEGKAGYVLIKYLAIYEPTSDSAFDDLDMPSYNLFKTRGTAALEYTWNGYTLLVRTNAAGDYEELMAVCYDKDLRPLWAVPAKTSYMTELTLLTAFIVEKAVPQLVIYQVDEGFTAYNIGPWADIQWQLAGDEVAHLGGLTVKAAQDGTFYAVGYYSDELICVSSEGKLVWVAHQTDDNVYWPYYIELTGSGIDVYYDSADNGYAYRSTFSYEGSLINTEVVPEPNIYDVDETEEVIYG